MHYEMLYQDFQNNIPDCRSFCYNKEKDNLIDSDSGIHTIFGMVIVPYIMKKIREKDDITVKKIFAFMENMAICKDVRVREVLDFTILEQLIDDGDNRLDHIKKYMGANTLENCEEIEKYLF